MLNYDFPAIQFIEHVLPYVDDDCFRVIEKDCGHTYINYVKMGPDTFPLFNCPADRSEVDEWNHRAAIRRECRGIAFHTRTGILMSRPFHKFFNFGEREDMELDLLNFDTQHWVCDKVDGSMLRPLWVDGELRWGTKMGLTDTAAIAERWLVDQPNYAALANYCREHGYTPIFEFVSKENRVVVDYGPTDMILLAIRDTDKGTYLTPPSVANFARQYNIPTARVYDSVNGDAHEFFARVKANDDLDEGVVVQWPNGHRGKAKTDTYSVLHRVKESARTERTLITAILQEEVDDLLPLLPVEDRDNLLRYIARFWFCCEQLAGDIAFMYEQVRDVYETKKDFALSSIAKDCTSIEKTTIFAMWDGKRVDAKAAAMHIVNQGLTSETKWAETKQTIAMSTNYHTFDAGWQTQEDVE